jgi:RNA-directed DNA polymerase
MTTPRYPDGCVAGSQVGGDAWSSDHVFIVNFNNGNVNNDNRNNKAFCRPVRSLVAGHCQDAVNLRSLHQAWRQARRHKLPSPNQLSFDSQWIDGLLQLEQQLNAGTWSPRPATCFIAKRPKARQIHAPDFADRIVHHWLVPQLETVFESGFIHDSYANRRGKGTHKAVERLQQFARQVDSGQGGGWYLQLDIHNFFNSIHRGVLYRMLKPRLERAGAPLTVLRTVHALLRHPVRRQGIIHRSTAAERTQVPPHKRLENAAPGCGLPIGNLSSQFFANVYLDALDQFVKHTLKAQRYLRYVDDFVLVHHDRAQLESWQVQIEQFLADHLQLKLKADIRLRPLRAGCDFLGYVVFPTHIKVRQRVLRHAQQALAEWHRSHIRGDVAQATPEQLRQLSSRWASYQGHLKHASSWRLQQLILARKPWLSSLTSVRRRFSYRLEGKPVSIRVRHS